LSAGSCRLWAASISAALAVAAPAAAAPDWRANVLAAERYAQARSGLEAFALVDGTGKLRGRLRDRVYPSRSVLKAMLLVAYLNRPSVRARALSSDERNLLEPMIRWSANEPATYLVRLMGHRPLNRLARRAGMTRFRLVISPWGRSEITARDQALFFRRVDLLVPERHRTYARRLLASIVPSQRWGIPPAVPRGWHVYFKGGWGSGTGWHTHQVALLRLGKRRVSVAILTQGSPTFAYGAATIRGIAARLLRGLR
jgi:Beta-lactamase enzyme family